MRSQDQRNPGEHRTDELCLALAEWRESEPAGSVLSPSTRARILRSVKGLDRSPAPRISLSALFVPAWKLALGAAAPLLLTVLLLGPQLLPVAPPATTAGETRVETAKISGEVVFMIANGSTVHRVSKSNDISMIDSVEVTVVTQGAFRDRLDSDADLVFYRID